jgi:exosortase/archaeosortase family protein
MRLGEAMTSSMPKASARAYLGLALLGWGTAILVGVIPKEDRLVGAGLLVFGAALLATAPSWPHVAVPRWLVASTGAVALLGVPVYNAFAGSPFNPAKIAIMALGLLLLVAAPFVDARLPLRREVTIGTLVVGALTAFLAPLLVYAIQGAFEATSGATPIEAFLRYGLLMPLAWFVAAAGWDPRLSGQTMTYTTRQGDMALEVGVACSGIQAMALFSAVLALFMFVERPRGRSLALWTALGLGGIYVANLLRLFMLAWVGHQWGGEALEKAHAQAGWMFFVAWTLLFAWLIRRRRASQRPIATAPPRPARPQP